MTKETYIKAFNGSILGILEEKDNGDQLIRDWPGRQILGYYYANRDVTTDFYGRVIARGNIITSLLTNKSR